MSAVWAVVATAVAILSNPRVADASPVDGRWKFEYSCEGATGSFADRCAAGDRDVFEMGLRDHAGKICGFYELTAQLGKHVDDGDLSDWTFQGTASPARFRVHFRFSGSSGEAIVRVSGSKLYWHTKAEKTEPEAERLTWTFKPPKDAVLTKETPRPGKGAAVCGG